MNMFDETLQLLDSGRNWRQGLNPDFKVCLGVAIHRTFDSVKAYAAWEAISKIIVAQYPERVIETDSSLSIVVDFNDHKKTTWIDVERVLEKAALQDE